MTLVGVMLGTVVMLADVGIRALWYGGARRRTSQSRDGGAQALVFLVAIALVILAPILAQLMYFALSRRREYLADASAALFTRYPLGLASALEKIAGSPVPLRSANRATAPMFIVNPMKITGGRLADLTRTHPPTSERVRILRAMAGGRLSLARYDDSFRRVTGRAVGVVPAGSVRAAQEIAAREEATQDTRSNIERVRGVTDALWRLQQYVFLLCACGVSLKVPPAHQGKQIHCPQCGRPHTATREETVAADEQQRSG
jgi:heat shock protein HtpX